MATTKPCTNCPSSCSIYPDACDECKEYKEELLDALYWVENRDEYYDGFEIVSPNAQANAGTVLCPSCGAPVSATAKFCEYCGTQLSAEAEKIQVHSAAEIPDPILSAQDLIYDRREIVKSYSKSSGLLGSLKNIFGSSTDSLDLGDKMTVAEIENMANKYGVTVSSYLAGLDDGLYKSYYQNYGCSTDEARPASIVPMLIGAAAAGSAVKRRGRKMPRRRPEGRRPVAVGGPVHDVPGARPEQHKPQMQTPNHNVQQPKPQMQQQHNQQKPSVGATAHGSAGFSTQQHGMGREDNRPQQSSNRPQQNNTRPQQSSNRPQQNNARPQQTSNRPQQGNNNRPNQGGRPGGQQGSGRGGRGR